jgi:hypothetical protein
MADRPILFSAPMVRALLDGRKTQTRRILKPQPTVNSAGLLVWERKGWWVQGDPSSVAIAQRIHRNDRLWVKETHGIVPRTAYRMSEGVQQTLRPNDDHDAAVYREGWERSQPGRWRPSIHMPRWASRLTLTVTEVRVERLQDCSEADALAEGVPSDDDYAGSFAKEYCHHCGGSGLHGAFGAGYGVTEVDCAQCETPQLRYRNLWDHINGEGSWDQNPWVAAYTFTVQHGNIDQIGRAAA